MAVSDTITIQGLEALAINTLRGYKPNEPSDIAIKRAMTIMWDSSISAMRICEIANAVYGMHLAPQHLAPSLAAMVRAKILRSRRVRGLTLYEVNY